MRKLYLTGLLISISAISVAQKNTVGSGGDASGSGGSLSYTVGQIDYTSQTGTTGNTNHGVQQPFEFYKISSSGIDETVKFEVNLYPNPTNEFVILKINSSLDDLSYQLFDMTGRIVDKGIISSNETKIDAVNYAPGQYQLSISRKEKEIELFKIIKNQ